MTADSAGAVYLITGNGNRDAATHWYGDAFLKLSPSLALQGMFGPSDPDNLMQAHDVDLGSAGALLLPRTRRLVGGGKTGFLYLVDADSMQELQEFQGFINVYDPTFDPLSDWEGGPHLHGGPVAWQTADPNIVTFYSWAENERLKAFAYDRAHDRFDAASPRVGSVLAVQNIMPGGMISLSADLDRPGSAIIWATLPREDLTGRLLAFDAETLALLWETDFPLITKWMPPTVADGKVFVPTMSNQLLVYALAP
jgi:hypothetical protein